MEFVLYCLDKPGRAGVRGATRVPHLAYTGSRQQVFRFGGPLLDDAGQARGSLMVLELPDRAALDAHMQADPFFSADLFESVTVWSTRQVMPEREPGALERELIGARTLAASAAASAAPVPIPFVKPSADHTRF